VFNSRARLRILKRKAVGVGLIAGAVIAVILVAVGGTLVYQDTMQQQSILSNGAGSQSTSSGQSGNDIVGGLSGALAVLKDAIASGGGLAQVQTNGVGLIADTFTGDAPLAPTCSATPKNSYIGLTNKGSANGTVTSVTITYGGEKNDFSIAGTCKVGPSGSPTATMYVLFRGPSKLANSNVPQPGLPYLGTVTLSSGAHLPFTGTWFQGYAQISNASVSLPASNFTQGKPTNTTCSTIPAPGKAYVALTNTGTVGVSATLVTITWKDVTNTFSLGGACFIGPDGTPSAVTYILFGATNSLSVAAVAGQPFMGSVDLSFGSPIAFSGSFQ
jgi:hypothetical protein